MPFLEIDAVRLFYEEAGDGPPIVFASGWCMTQTCWEPTVERLSRRFRCVLYDPRGVGRSIATEHASFEIDDHVGDLRAVCEATEALDAHLVGHDLGGRVAAIAARRHPQLAATLTIVGWWGAAEIHEAVGDFARFRQAASLLLRDFGALPFVRNLVAWSYRRAPEPYRTRLFDEYADVDARAAYMTAVAASDPLASGAFDDAIARLEIPVLLVQGGEDREAARRGLRALFERLPHVDLATIHGAGPLPMLEHPKAFVRTLSAFLGDHAPGGRLP